MGPAANPPRVEGQAAGPQPQAVAPPDARPQLIGRVRSVSGRTITLTTVQGPRLFQLAEDVVVVRPVEGGEEPAPLDAVVPGVHLAVFGRIEDTGTPQLIARRLVLLPPQAPSWAGPP